MCIYTYIHRERDSYYDYCHMLITNNSTIIVRYPIAFRDARGDGSRRRAAQAGLLRPG